jgi:type II secretory pathway component PulC
VRIFRNYKLLLGLLLWGIPVYLLLPPIFNTPDDGDGAVLHDDAGMAVVSRVADRPTHTFEDYRAIWEQNVFRTGKSESPAKEATVVEIPLSDGGLGLKLVGTAVMENSGKSFATIQHLDTGLQESCREGSRLDRVVIKKILQDEVIIEAGGDEMILSMDPFRAIGKNRVMIAKDSQTTRNVSASAYPARLNREEVSREYPDYLSFMKTAGIESQFHAGSPGGILVRNIDARGLFGKIGLQDGDVIKEINGEPLIGSADAVKIYDRLKHGGRVNLEIQRGKESMRLRLYVG